MLSVFGNSLCMFDIFICLIYFGLFKQYQITCKEIEINTPDKQLGDHHIS